MKSLYEQWLEAYLYAGISAISVDTSARIMAVLYEYGNNEGYTLNHKFLDEMRYIQKRFRLQGGDTPDAYFSGLLRKYIKELQDYYEAHKDAGDKLIDRVPEWAPRLLKERYGIKFIG